jgi:uncharacterized protein (TIGR00730 family)
MKVCICGGTNPATNPKYYEVASEVGDLLVNNDFEMVWGGNAFGVLSHVHKKYIEKQRANTLVIPKAYEDDLKTMNTDTVYKTEQVMERTQAMFSMTNVVIVMPGGIGTIYEFWTAVECKRAEEYELDIILLNYDNFYKHQLEHFDFINKHGFTKTGKGGAPYKIAPEELFRVVETPTELLAVLNDIRKNKK